MESQISTTSEKTETSGHINRRPDIPVADRLLVTPREAGQMLGCGRTKVFEMMNDGRFTRVPRGGQTLIQVSEIKALVETEVQAAKRAQAA